MTPTGHSALNLIPDRVRRRVARLPVRWRVALVSAALTLLILLAFALVVGTLTADRLRSDFNSRITAAAADLQSRLRVSLNPTGGYTITGPDLDDYVRAEPAVVRVVSFTGQTMGGTQNAPDLGRPDTRFKTVNGFRVVARPLPVEFGVPIAYVEYARPLSQVSHTVNKLWLFLGLGVFGGTALALLAGLAVARRAMRPVADLTAAAREIERTRNPRHDLPQSQAQDEVADLARTLAEMLGALDQARSETEATLGRQRRFIADASHELRTPLTSILANLELLQERLETGGGEEREMVDAAFRSSQRMRRLVADLLLLARSDAGRLSSHALVDLREIVAEAVRELRPLAADHPLRLRMSDNDAYVSGNRDDLHRLVVNLVDNSLRHTPSGTHVDVRVDAANGEVVLEVADSGPGISAELSERVFDRFTRTGNDASSGTGLGLAIVKAVAESHGGSAVIDSPNGAGTRCVVRLPAEPAGTR